MTKRYWRPYVGGMAAAAAVAAVAVVAVAASSGSPARQVKVGSAGPTVPVPLQVQSAPAAGATPLPSLLAIPNAPSGIVGSSTNPLGSPIQSLASCAAAALTSLLHGVSG